MLRCGLEVRTPARLGRCGRPQLPACPYGSDRAMSESYSSDMIGMDSDPFSIELSQQYAGSVLEPLAQGKVVLCFTIFDEVFKRNVLFVTCVLHPEAWDIAMCSN